MSNRPMSAKQYKAALADFKLSQPRACWLFGGKSKSSGRLWPAEGAPYYVALIISLMRMYHITPDDLEEIGAVFRQGKVASQQELEEVFQQQKRRQRKQQRQRK